MPKTYDDYDALERAISRAERKFEKAEQVYFAARDELAELRSQRGAFLGGWASGRSRGDWDRDEAIRSAYQPGKRHCVRDLARKHGLTTRQIYRIIKAPPPKLL